MPESPGAIPRDRTGLALVIGGLVVIGILAGLLLFTKSHTTERPMRAACKNNLRQLTLANLMYAGDSRERFADDGSEAPYYIGAAYRDRMNQEYKVQRPSFYCPSNPGWDKKDNTFWFFSSGNNPAEPAVIGYFYFAGYAPFNAAANVGFYYPGDGALPGGDNLRSHLPVFAMRTTDQPYFSLLWTDINAKYLGTWVRENTLTDGEVRRANHFEKQAPVGANEGYTDGHVEWVKFQKFARAPRMQYSSLDIYFHGNQPL